MLHFYLHTGWTVANLNIPHQKQFVTLPHDAMLAESRKDTNPGGANISFFAGGDYVYERTLRCPEDLPGYAAGMQVVLEFEGVYQQAQVYLNGQLIVERPYGYTNFYADLTTALKDGDNQLKVIARNSNQPNSRWYTGSGIYRPVVVHLLPKKHVLLNGIRVSTTSIDTPAVQVTVKTNASGHLTIDVLDDKGVQLASKGMDTDGNASADIALPGAKLWSPEHPNLCRCRVTFEGDVEETIFGIRTISCDSKKGFCVNGERVILRGACIHHDNGLLGAVCHPFAEERKVQLLKETGYNALRMAHNPCSKALLDICDRLGILVMDEYLDMWYIHKTKYDYVDFFDQWWEQDLADMVDKDFNHPCVALYSIGNEVAETSQPKGIALTETMTQKLHELDASRPVTCGVNIFFNYLYSLGFGVYTDKKAEEAVEVPGKKKKTVGSEFFNTLAGIVGAGFMKFGASLHGSDVKTRNAYAKMDVAGYNYGINRYKKDLKHYPNRVIVGSETFCADAYKFMEIAKDNPALIGDFVWAGIDYLGEAGIGAWEYGDYAKEFDHLSGWLTAGAGRLDITGRSYGEALYTRVAFGLLNIGMAVQPVYPKGEKHSLSAWKLTNALPSWSWQGCEGLTATVEVYTQAFKAALYLNGKKVAEKRRPKHDCRILFTLPYEAGTLTACALDENGAKLYETSLTTSGDETQLTLCPEKQQISLDDLAYIRIRYTDGKGETKPKIRGKVKVTVEGGTLLGLGNGCAYHEAGYLTDTTDAYYGEAMAVIRPNGKGTLCVHADGAWGMAETTVTVV